MRIFIIAPEQFQLGAGSGLVTLPDGTKAVGAGYGSMFSYDLGVTPAQLQADPNRPGYYIDGIYALTFSQQNQAPAYPGYYTAEIDFGTQELSESSSWGARAFTQITFNGFCHAYIVADAELPGGGPVQGTKNLILNFKVNDGSANGGWAILFKNVSLTFTPSN